MKKNSDQDELRPEYTKSDLGKGIRGKNLKKFQEGSNLVLLTPEVAKVFPTPESVNEALLSLIKIAERTNEKRAASKR